MQIDVKVRELNLYTPLRVLDFLSHKVQSVPARVGEQGGVEGQGDVPGVVRRPLEGSFKVSCVTFKKKQMSVFKDCKET